MTYICFTNSNMNTLESIGLLAVVITLVIYIGFWLYDKRNTGKMNLPTMTDPSIRSLQLTAYERLVILADRISLVNLLTRVPSGELTVPQYQKLLTETIRQEFDYNISQQLYVATPIWEAISNLKEQNIYIIHQVAQSFPSNTNGSALSMRILEMLQQDPNVSLHPIVLDAIHFEAKKLIK